MITKGVYASVVIIDFGGLLRWRGCHDADTYRRDAPFHTDFFAVSRAARTEREAAENRGKSPSMSEPDNAIPATNVVLLVRAAQRVVSS